MAPAAHPDRVAGNRRARNLAVYFISLSSSPALAILCPREEWCNFSAKAIATDIRSCRNMERSRRSLLRFAEPEETRSARKPSAGFGIITVTQQGNTCLSQTPVVVVVRSVVSQVFELRKGGVFARVPPQHDSFVLKTPQQHCPYLNQSKEPSAQL